MIRRISLPARLAVLVLWLPACTDLPPLPEPIKLNATSCERFFQAIDNQVDEYGVGDAGAAKISGFAGLRVDRFLASFAQQNLTADAYAAWLERLRKLDETARLLEWRNLPDKAKYRLQSSETGDVEVAIHRCGQILAQQVQNSPSQRSRLQAELQSPEAYSTWQRLFGLYFLTRWAIVDGVWQLQQEMRAPFLNNDQDQAVKGQLIRYVPPTSPAIQTAEVAAILKQSAANPLAIPEPSTDQLYQLFSAFAPAWLVDTLSDNDRIGMVNITDDGDAYIDTHKPVVYHLPSHARYGKQVLLQLNYIVWFSARPPSGLLDIYAGRFDGLIWRVTLKMDGQPLAYDSIHPCGCYYQIFPAEGVRVVQPEDGSEPILTPTPILADQPGERVLVKISAENHFITGIATQQPAAVVEKYSWLAYDALRSLPMPNGGYQSIFDQDGLMPGSERSERFLLWPMGVPSAGAMRQWGTHAIAFLGKRHFDDPWLLDKLIRPLWE